MKPCPVSAPVCWLGIKEMRGYFNSHIKPRTPEYTASRRVEAVASEQAAAEAESSRVLRNRKAAEARAKGKQRAAEVEAEAEEEAEEQEHGEDTEEDLDVVSTDAVPQPAATQTRSSKRAAADASLTPHVQASANAATEPMLGRAVAVGHVRGAAAGLRETDRLREVIGERHRWHAVRGHLHELDGDLPAAASAYAEAARRATNVLERDHLVRQAARARAAAGSGDSRLTERRP